MHDDLITVGKLGKTRGVHGEMYVTLLTDFPDRFLDLEEVYVGSRDRWEKMSIASARLVGGRPVIALAAITSPEAASRFTNRELAVPRSQLVELPEDTFYIFDLIDCTVYDEATGESIGEVTDVESYPANDVYVVKMHDGAIRHCPAIKEVVKQVDVANKKIVIAAERLLEEE